MKFLYAIALGAATALGATLIHQTLPPFGVALGIFTTYIMIWWVAVTAASVAIASTHSLLGF